MYVVFNRVLIKNLTVGRPAEERIEMYKILMDQVMINNKREINKYWQTTLLPTGEACSFKGTTRFQPSKFPLHHGIFTEVPFSRMGRSCTVDWCDFQQLRDPSNYWVQSTNQHTTWPVGLVIFIVIVFLLCTDEILT